MKELLPTGTVTLLSADIEGSAQLWETQPEQMAAAVARLGRTLVGVVAAHSGVRAGGQCEGDRFVAAFPSAGDALACAIALQRAPLAPIRLQIGLHTGEAQLNEGDNGDKGDHYVGPTIDRAARLRDLAHGGQTLLSGVTEELVAEQLPDGMWLTDLGIFVLRGAPRPERVVQMCHLDLRNEFPPLWVGGSAIGRRFPVQLTSFVGRDAELADIRQLVDDHRLVTLTGVGGIGKTRLAVQLGTDLADRFGNGVWYVDLAPITDPDLVAVRVVRTLGLPDQPGRSTLDTLARFIDGRQMLMVLDSCEHVLGACAELVAALLEACPELTIMATSREPIGVAGEVTWRTPSLPHADEAVELFIDRARLARPDFTVTGDDTAAVAEICRRLDGVPLAIELAAARVRALSLTEILAGLQDRFRLLTGGARTAVPRHQTLRASVDWSHALLSEPERLVFRRLAVFLGGFDLDAARAVVGGDELQPHQAVDVLALLVDKSLVVADDSGQGTRYALLETVRHYALDKLAASDEADTVRTRHRDHYTALFNAPVSVDRQQWVDRGELEIDNLRAAFAWSREHGDVALAARLASSLQLLWLRGRIREGLAWFDAVLADSATAAKVAPAARARTLADKLILDHLAGVYDNATQADEALAIARDLDDPDLLARVLTGCGVAYIFAAEVALPYFAEAAEVVRGLNDDWQLGWVLGWQAGAAYVAGDPVAGRAAAQEGRDLADVIGDGVLVCLCGWSLGLAQWLTADLAGAAAQFGKVAATAQANHDPIWIVYGLFMLAKTRAYQGDTSGARDAAEAAIEAAADLTGVQQALAFGALADASLAAADVAAAIGACDAGWRACPQVYLLAVNGFPMARTALASGDVGRAHRWADDGISVATGAHQMMFLAVRARVAIAEGDFEQADRDAYKALAIAAETAACLMIPDVVECLAIISADSGDQAEAARLLGAAQAIRDRTGQVRFEIYQADYRTSLTQLRDAMGGNDFDAHFAEGATLPTDEAIAYAVRGRGERKRPSSGWASLTPTERDVVQFVGKGLGNKDIAARLFVSPRTVQTHLTHAYTKLGLTSRVQLAQEAARRG